MKIPVYYPAPGIRGDALESRNNLYLRWVYSLYSKRALMKSDYPYPWDDTYKFIERMSS